MSSNLFRTIVGALAVLSVALIIAFRMIGTEENAGQLVRTTQSLSSPQVEFAEPVPVQSMADQESETWFDEDIVEMQDESEPEPTFAEEVIDAGPDLVPEVGAFDDFDDDVGGWAE